MTETIKDAITSNVGMANETTIQELPNKQLIATIPRALGQALGWKKGDTLTWEVQDGKIVLTRKAK